MAQYAITYLGGDHPSSPEDREKHMAEYRKWIGSLGESAVSPMNPFKDTKTIKPDRSISDGSSTAMSGYTIIMADSMEKALESVKTCPFLDINGTLEVSELVEMPGPA